MSKEAPGQVAAYPFAQPGDVIFARGHGLLSRLIRWAERSKGESESWANHVGGVTTPGYLVPPQNRITALAKVSESLWTVDENVWWERHGLEEGYTVAVFRPRHFTGNEGVQRVVENWRSRTGNKYGWWRLFGFLGERLTGGLIPFTKLFFKDDRIVCSNHVLLGLATDGIKIDTDDGDPHRLDPDEFCDYCIAHPEEFKFIGQATVPVGRVL